MKTREEKLNEIIVPHGERQYLGKLFNRSQPYIRMVLRGERNDYYARRIRQAALKNGGKEIVILKK